MRNLIETTSFGAYVLFVGGLMFVNLVSVAVMVVLPKVAGIAVPMHEGMIAYQLAGVLGAVVIYSGIFAEQRSSWPDVDRFGLDAVGLSLLIVTAVVLGVWANAAMGVVLELVPQLQAFAEAYEAQMRKLVFDATGIDRVLGVVSICLIAPVVEEALFRGTILPEQRKSERVSRAVIVNGLLFAAFHLNPVNFFPLVPVGAFLAHVTVRTGSLLPAILAHAVLNGFNGVVLPEVFPGSVDQGSLEPTAVFGQQLPISSTGQLFILLVGISVVVGVLWALTVGRAQSNPDREAAG